MSLITIESQSPTLDNYAFLSNPHTFLIRNSNSIQRDKTIEYSNILSRGSMKDLHHEQYKKDLVDNRQKTSRNTRNNQSKTIFNKVNNYTKELKDSITSKKRKTILIPQHLSCATPRNYINQPYHSSIPLCSSKIKNMTITRNKKSANPLEWSTYNSINMKPIKKTIYTVASIDLRNLKTSDLTMGTFKNKANY